MGKPIAVTTGYYGGKATVKALDGTLVLPVGIALYTQPAPPADSVLEDAARYRWLFDARTEAEVANANDTVFKPLPQDEVLSRLQGFYMSKAHVDAAIDAAIAAQQGDSNEL